MTTVLIIVIGIAVAYAIGKAFVGDREHWDL